MGAAALMAEHKGLIFRPEDGELAVARSYLTTTYGRELPVIVPPAVYRMLGFGQVESAAQATGVGWQSLSLFISGVGCGVAMLALLLFGYRSIRSRFASGEVRLPPDVEDGYS